MRSACFFATYFTGSELPYYIRVYLKELKRHFTEVTLLCPQQLSPESLEFLGSAGLKQQVEKNEGYDFGQWYKAFQKVNIEKYDQIALVNDSCILFRPLDEFMAWARTDWADMQGMTYSEAIAPHLQSYFLLINKPAIKPIKDFFNTHRIVYGIADVIRTYEVGMSSYLLGLGLKISAYMGREGAEGEFSPYYSHVKLHLAEGIPLIKKKILFSSYRKDELPTLARMDFDVDPAAYVQLIRKYTKDPILSFETLFKSEPNKMSAPARIKYNFMRLFIRVYRKLK